jgi:hypothetical protein
MSGNFGISSAPRNKYLSVLVCLVTGLLYISIPHVLLPVCEYAAPASGEHSSAPDGGERGAHGTHGAHMAMPSTSGHSGQEHAVCFWTARAEAGLGGLIVFGAFLLLLSNSLERRSGISLMLAGSTVLGALIPTVLIGVCQQETMPCRIGTLPALLLLSGFFFLFFLLNSFYLVKRRKTDND